jgi:hypothetical protein
MFVTLQLLRAGEQTDKLTRVMDQDWEVLRANPVVFILVLNRE